MEYNNALAESSAFTRNAVTFSSQIVDSWMIHRNERICSRYSLSTKLEVKGQCSFVSSRNVHSNNYTFIVETIMNTSEVYLHARI